MAEPDLKPVLAPDAIAQPPDEDPVLWRDGVRAGLPTLFGIAAWGVVVGVAMVKSGMSIFQALGMTLFVFAGTAQLAVLPLIAVDAPISVVFVTALVINLRFVIFAAILAPHFAHLPWRTRLLLGYTAGDLTVALFLQRFPSEARARGKLSFLKGLLYPNWAAWQVGSYIGIFLGAAVPAEWGLGFAGILAMLCIMVPLMHNLASVCGVLIAGVTGVLAHALPYKLGLLLALVVGMLCALAIESLVGRYGARTHV